MSTCEFCKTESDKSFPWVCETCIIAEKDLGMKTLSNSVLAPEIVVLLTEVYEALPEDKLSMEARDFILDLNDLEALDEVCIALTDVLTCLDNWHGKDAEIAKMRLEAEYERLWNGNPSAAPGDVTINGYRH